MAAYWQERLQKQQDILYDKTLAQTQAQLAKQYQAAVKAVTEDAKKLYDKLIAGGVKGEIRVNDLYKYNRYFELKNNLNQQLQELGAKEIELYTKSMTNMYQATNSMVGKSFNSMIDSTRAKSVLDSVWCSDGRHWSERVWGNKQVLQQRIEKGLVDCVARGVPKDELIKQLRKDFNTGFSDADRIVRTELSHVQNQAAADGYKSAGFDKYEFLAAIDERTSDECSELNGEVFLFDEAQVGINFPPIHVNCRSTIVAAK